MVWFYQYAGDFDATRDDYSRRKRGCCFGGLPVERGNSDLSDYPVFADGRAGGSMDGRGAEKHLERGATGGGDAERRRRGRYPARRLTGRRSRNDLHGVARIAVDD